MEEQWRRGPTLIESLWQFRLVVVAATIVGGILGFVLGAQQPESYDASARLFLSLPNQAQGLQDFGLQVTIDEYVPQQAARLTSRTVLSGAAELLDHRLSVDDIASAVRVSAQPQELLLVISATAPTGEDAAAIANAVGQAYANQRRGSELESAERAAQVLDSQITPILEELEELSSALEADPGNAALENRISRSQERLIELESTITDSRVSAALRGSGVDDFETAEVPGSPARPQPRLTAITFALLGLVASAMWAYWYAAKSQRAVERTDPERVLGVPPLGEVPLYRQTGDDPLTSLVKLDPAAAEAYEFVLSSIEFALAEIGGKRLLVTSALPGDGKTSTALQLAIAASRDRRRVVLVDADIRAMGLTTVLRAEQRIGLTDLTALDLEADEVVRRYRFSEQSQLPVVTAGQRRGDPTSLLRTHTFRRAMQKIGDEAELLIVDTSPILAVADATIVAGTVDGIVLVVSHGTPMSELQKVRERLAFVSTPLIGYIFNRSENTTAAAYGYGYGVSEDESGGRQLLPRSRLREERKRAHRDRQRSRAT